MSVGCRQNFHLDNEAGINRQINILLHASYVYMSMEWYYDRDDVALPGLHKFLHELSENKRELAEKLMKYQNERGGRIVLQTIKAPEREVWGSALDGMQAVLEMEKNVNRTLLDLHQLAEQHNDAQMGDWIEGEFLKDSVELIKKIGDHVTSLKRVGPGLGEYTFDQEIKS